MRIALGILLVAVLIAACLADAPADADIESPVIPASDDVAIPFLRRPSLFQLDPPKPTTLTPTTPDDAARDRLRKMEEAEEEFTAPPLVVARIATLPVDSGDSPTQALYRAERNFIRERARAADRLFQRGDAEAALAMMAETERLLQTTSLRITALNRLAAYRFRLGQFNESAAYARKAWEMDTTDPVSACNLAAVLLSAGRADEALDILLRIYGQSFNRPQIAFAVHFNLACAYSMKGEQTPAIQNLALAAQIDPFATYAAYGDTQLDPLRENPDFLRIRDAIERMIQSGQARPLTDHFSK